MDPETIAAIGGYALMSVIFGMAGWAIGRRKGRPGLGFVLGAGFWILGLVAIALINRSDDDGPRPSLP